MEFKGILRDSDGLYGFLTGFSGIFLFFEGFRVSLTDLMDSKGF